MTYTPTDPDILGAPITGRIYYVRGKRAVAHGPASNGLWLFHSLATGSALTELPENCPEVEF